MERDPGKEVVFMATVEAAIGWQKWMILAELLVIFVLAFLLYQGDSAMDEAVRHPQLAVVPGAVAGLYTAGISQANLQDAALNLASLPLDITPKNVDQKYKQFEYFLSPKALYIFQKAAPHLEKDIHSRDESRVFIPDKQKLVRIGDNKYQFTETGVYEFFSGDIHLGSPEYQVDMVFTVDDEPTPTNPYGLVIHKFQVQEVTA